MSKPNNQHAVKGESLKKVAASWRVRAANYRQKALSLPKCPRRLILLEIAKAMRGQAQDLTYEGKRASSAR